MDSPSYPPSMPPTPWPREGSVQFENARVTITDQAHTWVSRQVQHSREMLESYYAEIKRLEELLEDYKQGARILEQLIIPDTKMIEENSTNGG